MSNSRDLFGSTDNKHQAIGTKFFATRKTFLQEMFADVRYADIISYCASPAVILDSFREAGLDSMRLFIGNRNPSEALGQDDIETVRELTELRREDRLDLHYAPNYEVHSKMYRLKTEDGTWRLASGSANFTANGWGGGRQANHLVVVETSDDSDYYHRFTGDFEEHFERYGEPYLEELSRQLEETEEDPEVVIGRWLGVEDQTRDEVEAVTGDIKDIIIEESRESNFETNVSLSADRFDKLPDDVVEQADETVKSAGGETYQYGRSSAARLAQRTAGVDVPMLNYDPEGRTLLLTTPQSPQTLDLREQAPKVGLADSLTQLHQYFDYVDEYGVGSAKKKHTVKTYMYEVLIYMLWAPLINLQIHYDLVNDMRNLEKNVPFLYIHGVTSTGKGTFVEYCLRLISNGLVDRPIAGDELGKTLLRRVRSYDSSFPVVFDDVKKNQIRNTGNLLNKYWEPLITSFNGDLPSPAATALVFTSNDNRPGTEILERAQLYEFDVQFPEEGSKRRERDIERHKKRDNALYGYFLDQLFEDEEHLPPPRDLPRDHPLTSSDFLKLPRTVMLELYDRADLEVPEYFPDQPARDIIDLGRQNWRERIQEGDCDFQHDEEAGRIEIRFPSEEYAPHEIDEMIKDIPTGIASNPKRRGTRVTVEGTRQFLDWITREGKEPLEKESGLLQKLGKWFPG